MSRSDRTPSDPAHGLRALKRWVRLGVYGVVLAFVPFNAFVLGHPASELVVSAVLGIVAATLCIEWTFGQMLKARQKQLESESKQRAVLNAIPDAIFQVDRDGRILDVLAPEGFALRLRPEEMVGRSVYDMLPPSVGEEVRRLIPDVLASGALRTLEYDIDVGGETKAREARIVPCGADAVLAVVRDVTDRRRAESRLRALSGAFEMSADAIIVTDLSGRIVEVNDAALKMHGGEHESDLVGRMAFDLIVEDERAQAVEGMREVLAEGHLAGREYTVVVKDGGRVKIELSVAVIRDAQGAPTGFVGIARDITERKRIEEALRQREEYFRTLIENASDVITVLDPSGTSLYNSPAMKRVLGYDPEEMVGQNAFSFIHPDDLAEVGARFSELLQDPPGPRSAEFRFRHKDGYWRYLESVATVDIDGSSLHVIVNSRDVTGRRETAERYRLLFERSLAGVYRTSLDGRLLQCNEALARIMGYESPEELTEHAVGTHYIDPAERDRFVKEIMEHGRVSNFEVCLRRRDGTVLWVLESATLLLDQEAGDAVIEGTFIDITERKSAEEMLQRRARHRSVIAELSQKALAVTNLQLLFEEAVRLIADNLELEYSKLLELLPAGDAFVIRAGVGWREGLVGRATVGAGRDSQAGYTLLSGAPVLVEDLHDETRFEGHDLLHAHGIVSGLSVLVPGRDRPFGVLSAHATRRRAFSDDDIYLMQMVGDILAAAVERRRAEASVEEMAYHDGLTGLPNRALFKDRLDQALAQARRSGEQVAVMFLDLDDFKVVNDTLGHVKGDELLALFGERIAGLVRQGDTVARVGGDEFTVLLPRLTGPKPAVEVAERILDDLRRPWTIENREFVVTGSIGITLFPADGGDPDTLLSNADTAMYQAKAAGRNSYRLYTPAMHDAIAKRLTLETELRHAIELQQFVLHYQPQVAVCTEAVIGVEALLRWDHPERGLLYPKDFIEVAEESGLIVPIGQWVLETACKQTREWHESGLDVPRLAVNLSERQFQRQKLVAVVRDILESTRLKSSVLQLEITERAAMQDVDLTIRTLSALRRMGVEIALDDFGTGHSSLSYLRRLPIDAIKIDSSFIQDIGADEAAAAVVRAIITVGHTLGLKVIAEGVERPDQLAFLRDPTIMNEPQGARPCDEFQGFLFSRPLPAEAIAPLLPARASAQPVSGTKRKTPAARG